MEGFWPPSTEEIHSEVKTRMAVRILVINEGPDSLKQVENYFEGTENRFTIETADTIDGAFSSIRDLEYDIVLTDSSVLSITGSELLRKLGDEGCSTPIIFLSEEPGQEAIQASDEDDRFHLKEGEDLERRSDGLMDTIEQVLGGISEVTESNSGEALYCQSRLLDDIETQVWYAVDPEVYGNVNRARADFLGMRKEEMEGRRLCEVMPPSEAEVCIAGNKEVFRTGEKYQKEEWVTDSEGKLRCLVVTKNPKLNNEGEVGYIVCTAHDITERKRAEQELRRTQKEMEQIIDFLPDATFVVDSDGKISAWNRAMERLTGYSKQEMMGKGVLARGKPFYGENRLIVVDLIFSEDEGEIESIKSCYDCIEREGDTYIAESYAPNLREGEGAYVWIMASPLYDENGETIGAIESVRDITERKNIHNDLELAHSKLNLISSVIRHDIYNKLSVIEGYNDLVLSNVKDEKLTRYLEKIRTNIEDIYDHLEFQRNYQRIGTQSPEWINVADDIKKQWLRFESWEVNLDIDFDSLEVYADPLLDNAFYNLIHNTLEHGRGVENIAVSYVEEEDHTRIIFEDNGVGISEEKKEKIFERGYGHASGFGLYLVKEIVKISGFEIEEVGTPDKGVRFEIMVPNSKCRR